MDETEKKNRYHAVLGAIFYSLKCALFDAFTYLLFRCEKCSLRSFEITLFDYFYYFIHELIILSLEAVIEYMLTASQKKKTSITA